MTIKPLSSLILGLLFLTITLLFVGIQRDREFWDASTFIKYKPTLQLIFISAGEDDLTNVSEQVIGKDARYNKYVERHQLPDFSSVIIQLTLSFTFLGMWGLVKNKSLPLQTLLWHFLICGILGAILGLSVLLYYLDSWMSYPICLIILGTNIITCNLLSKKLKRSKAVS